MSGLWVFAAAFYLLVGQAYLGCLYFWPVVFRTGPRVILRDVSLQPLPVPVGGVAQTQHGKYKVVQADLVYVRRRLLSFVPWQGLPLCGTIRWSGGSADFEARVPLGGVFAHLMLLGLFAAALASAAVGYGPRAIAVAAVGFLIVTGFVLLSARVTVKTEIGRMNTVLEEYASLVSEATHTPNKRIQRTAEPLD